MQASIDELKGQLDSLPERDRAELASYLIRSLEGEADPDADATRQVELARREAEIKAGLVEGVPAEEALRRLRTKF